MKVAGNTNLILHTWFLHLQMKYQLIIQKSANSLIDDTDMTITGSNNVT